MKWYQSAAIQLVMGFAVGGMVLCLVFFGLAIFGALEQDLYGIFVAIALTVGVTFFLSRMVMDHPLIYSGELRCGWLVRFGVFTGFAGIFIFGTTPAAGADASHTVPLVGAAISAVIFWIGSHLFRRRVEA